MFLIFYQNGLLISKRVQQRSKRNEILIVQSCKFGFMTDFTQRSCAFCKVMWKVSIRWKVRGFYGSKLSWKKSSEFSTRCKVRAFYGTIRRLFLTDWLDGTAFRIADALDRLGSNRNVAGAVTSERDLGTLLVRSRDLRTIRGPTRVLTYRAFAAKITEIPRAVLLTPATRKPKNRDSWVTGYKQCAPTTFFSNPRGNRNSDHSPNEVVVETRLPSQAESVLAAEEEWGHVPRVDVDSVISARGLRWNAAVDSRTAGRCPAQPVNNRIPRSPLHTRVKFTNASDPTTTSLSTFRMKSTCSSLQNIQTV
jgi:hypothetical protein